MSTRKAGAAVTLPLVVLLVVVATVVVRSRLGDGDATAGKPTCADPVFTSSERFGSWRNGGYQVDQDMWNSTVGTQTMHACSYRSWYITSTQPDPPSVKTYPDVNVDLKGARLDSFSEITSNFGSAGPGTGVYEYAYDVWFNGLATKHSTEIMIWTDNHGNVLHVPQRGTFTSRGRSYSAYRAGRFIAYVDTTNSSSGELDLTSFFDHAVAQGWLSPSAALDKVEFGVEVCSTSGVPMRFAVTDFSVEAS
jgi:hypothetical protein